MRLDPVASQSGAVEVPVRPDAGSDRSRVVDWFALTDSNLPEPEIVAAPAASPQSASEAVAVAGSFTGSWMALQAGTRRLWQGLLNRRKRPANGADPKLPPAVGGRR